MDWEPDVDSEATSLRSITLEQLKESIREEVSRLFNTRYSRIPFALAALNDNQRFENSLASYGLIDFSHFDVSRMSGRRKLSLHLQKALEYYEPRLTEIRIQVYPFNHRRQSIQVVIDGQIKAVPLGERYTFPVEIQKIS